MKRLLIFAAAIVAMQASAETYTWKGGTGTVDGWNTSTNWEPNGVPDAGDTAVFNNSVTISSAIALSEGELVISVPSSGSTAVYTVTLSGVISGAGGIAAEPAQWTSSGSKSNTVKLSGTASTFTGGFRVIGRGVTSVQELADLGQNSSIGRGTAGVPVQVIGGTFQVESTCTTDRPFYLHNYSQLNAASSKTVTFTGELTGSKIYCRIYGSFIFKSRITDNFTIVGRTDGGELRLDNDQNSFTVAPYANAGTLGFTSAADSGVSCALGTGNTVSIGQGNTTTAKLSYCGATDAAMNRKVEITFSTAFTEANYANYHKSIENRTAGTTFTLNGQVVNKTPAAQYALLRVGGAGDLWLNTAIPAGMYVQKYGSGTVTLAVDAIHDKPTTVSDGRLDVAGSFPAASAINVAGGTLGGTGVVHSATTVLPSGTLSAGTASECGTLTFDAVESPLTLQNGCIMSFKVDAARGTNDMVVVAGAPVASGIVTIQLQDAVPGVAYTLMKYDSPPANVFALGNGDSGMIEVGATELKVTVSGGSLVWAGDAANNVWDFTTANWVGGLFEDAKSVSFTDAGVSSVPVDVAQDVAPASVTVSASSGTYTFAGAGKITGNGGLVKTGACGLVIANTNDYAGVTVLEAGGTTLSGKMSGTSISVRSAATFRETPTGVIAGDDINLAFYTPDVILEGTNTFSGRVMFDLAGDSSTAARLVRLIHPYALGNAESLTIRPNAAGSVILQPSNSLTVAGKTLYMDRGAACYKVEISSNGLRNRRFEWTGDIKVPSGNDTPPWLNIGFSSGSTFFAGTLNETEISGFKYVVFRGDSTVTIRGRIDTEGEIIFNDYGTRVFESTNNVCAQWTLYQGLFRTGVDHVFATNAVLKIGKTIPGYSGHSIDVDLNGTTQQVAQIEEIGLDANASGTRRIKGDAPSTLIVKGAAASSFGSVTVNADGKVREGRIEGGVSLVKDGPSRFSLNASTNLFTGGVTVLGGVLAANAPFSLGNGRGLPAHPGLGEGDKDIVVAGGTLELNAEQEGIGGAVLSIGAKDGTAGVVALADGVVQRVRCLKIGGELRAPGVYGGAESAAPRRLGCFAGSGLLVVERGVSGGVVIFR